MMRRRTRFLETVPLWLAAAVTIATYAAPTFGQFTGLTSTAEHAAAIVVYPYITADTGVDTVIQLSNTGGAPARVHCFYEDTSGHCANNPARPCTADDACGGFPCLQQRLLFDFAIQLTPGQPVEWRVGVGASGSPIIGQIPPRPVFVGLLRCFLVDASGIPVQADALEGVATVESVSSGSPPQIDTVKYNAIGIPSVLNDGSSAADPTLQLGGPNAQYAACPNLTTFGHFFEGAVDPVSAQSRIQTDLVLVPCSVDYATNQPTSVMVHYVTFNEFAQRLGTSKRLTAQQVGSLTSIHPTVFDVGTQGTLAGHTELIRIDGGILALAIQREIVGQSVVSSAAFAVQHRGTNIAPDLIVLQPF